MSNFDQYRLDGYFKKGDRITCLHEASYLSKGRTYYTGKDSTIGDVKVVADDGQERGYYPGRFEHENGPKSQTTGPGWSVGDWVQCIDNSRCGVELTTAKVYKVESMDDKYTRVISDQGHREQGYLHSRFKKTTAQANKPVDPMTASRHKDAPLWDTDDLLVNRHTNEHRYFIRYHTADTKWIFAGKAPGQSDKLEYIVEWRDYVNTVKVEALAFSGTDHYPRGTKLKCIDPYKPHLEKGAMYYYRGPTGSNTFISETPDGPIIKCPHVSSGGWGESRFVKWDENTTAPTPTHMPRFRIGQAVKYITGPLVGRTRYVLKYDKQYVSIGETIGGPQSNIVIEDELVAVNDTPTHGVLKDSGPVQRTAPKRKAGALPRQKLLLL